MNREIKDENNLNKYPHESKTKDINEIPDEYKIKDANELLDEYKIRDTDDMNKIEDEEKEKPKKVFKLNEKPVDISEEEPERKTLIEVKHLSKLYGPDHKAAVKLRQEGDTKAEVLEKTGVTIALWDNNLDIKEGEIFVIIGLSGSGKSTLVRCFNLLNVPTKGEITFRGRDINKLSKKEAIEFKRENIAMVFQHFGLMSHRDVLGNVEYGLEVKGMDKTEREKIAIKMIEMVGLKGNEHKKIDKLSGGMKQRVGLARALANDPDVLLMDEPFSALDPLVRNDMQFELLNIQKRLGTTIIFITHDIDEAFKLGDRVAIMKDGEIIQIATPEEMATNPADEYVERFIETATKKNVISVGNIMIKPSSVVRLKDSPKFAIATMRSNKISSAYVVNTQMKLAGVVTIEQAVEAEKHDKKISEVMYRDILTTTPNTMVNDVISTAQKARYPIAVVEDDGTFVGIVTKADVLGTI